MFHIIPFQDVLFSLFVQFIIQLLAQCHRYHHHHHHRCHRRRHGRSVATVNCLGISST